MTATRRFGGLDETKPAAIVAEEAAARKQRRFMATKQLLLPYGMGSAEAGFTQHAGTQTMLSQGTIGFYPASSRNMNDGVSSLFLYSR
jgi:hypothetical protein